jgi:hypothetical protein
VRSELGHIVLSRGGARDGLFSSLQRNTPWSSVNKLNSTEADADPEEQVDGDRSQNYRPTAADVALKEFITKTVQERIVGDSTTSSGNGNGGGAGKRNNKKRNETGTQLTMCVDAKPLPRMIECPLKCEERKSAFLKEVRKIEDRFLKTHKDNDCPKRLAVCSQGCGKKMVRLRQENGSPISFSFFN